MTSTSSRHADFVARQNRALGHIKIDGKWVQKYQRDPDAQSPAGGVSSSVNDMTKWMRLQLAHGKFEGKDIVNKDALAETHHPIILTGFSPVDGLPGFYGLAWNVRYDSRGRLELSHSGAFALGAATTVALLPSEQIGIVILANASPSGVVEGLARTFLDNVIQREPKQDWLAIYTRAFAQMEQADDSRVGNYSKAPVSPARQPRTWHISEATRTTSLARSPLSKGTADSPSSRDQKNDLSDDHWNRDTFTYQTEGENAVGTAGITFTIGPDGKAQRVVVENLNIHREGVFERE